MARVGKDLKDHLFPTPCHGQGHLPPDQFAQRPIQPGFEHLQGWGIHNLFKQPVPVPHNPHSEEFPPKSIIFYLGPFILVLNKESFSILYISPLQVLKEE